MTYTVLLTAVGGPLSCQAILYLRESRRHDVRVVGVDVREDALGRHFADAFHAVPRGDADGYADAIAAIAAQHRVDLILPCSDEEALALAAARSRIEAEGCTLACAPAEMLTLMADKSRAFRFLAEAGLPVPLWRLCRTRHEVEAAIRDLGADGEFAIKPVRSRGNRGIFVVRRDLDQEETSPSGRERHLPRALFEQRHLSGIDAALPLLVMERLVPPAYDVDTLSWQGEALRVVPRRRLNTEGVPFLGNEIVDAPALIALARRIAKAAKLSWLYDFDIMTRRDGTPVVLELNPRPSGSLTAAIAAGTPLLDDLVSLAKGEALDPAPPLKHGTVVLPYTRLAVVQA